MGQGGHVGQAEVQALAGQGVHGVGAVAQQHPARPVNAVGAAQHQRPSVAWARQAQRPAGTARGLHQRLLEGGGIGGHEGLDLLGRHGPHHPVALPRAGLVKGQQGQHIGLGKPLPGHARMGMLTHHAGGQGMVAIGTLVKVHTQGRPGLGILAFAQQEQLGRRLRMRSTDGVQALG